MLNNIAGVLSVPTPVATNSYESIATVNAGAGGASTITFSSIPSTFKHLQIRYTARAHTTSAGGGLFAMVIQLNGITTNSYRYHWLLGNGSTASANQYGLDNGDYGYAHIPSDSSNPNIFGIGIVDILDYTNTNKNKTLRRLSGVDSNSADNSNIELTSGLLQTTNAITSITCTISSNTFAQYSSIALYGIKG